MALRLEFSPAVLYVVRCTVTCVTCRNPNAVETTLGCVSRDGGGETNKLVNVTNRIMLAFCPVNSFIATSRGYNK